jgi:hypothetical protein
MGSEVTTVWWRGLQVRFIKELQTLAGHDRLALVQHGHTDVVKMRDLDVVVMPL